MLDVSGYGAQAPVGHCPRMAPLRFADTGREGRPPPRPQPIGELLRRQRLGMTERRRSRLRDLPRGWELVDLGDRTREKLEEANVD